jgi:hypothetical protein
MSVEADHRPVKERLIELAAWLTGFVWLTIIIPSIIIIKLPPEQWSDAIATWVANPFIEYLSVGIGIGLGLNPLISFLLTILPCTGLAFLSFGLLGFLGDSSPRAVRFMKKTRLRIEKYPRLSKYGVASNLIFPMILGVYIAPGISIILGWSRIRSILFMIGGITLITALIGLVTMGIIDLLFV